jgi:hypothetical protein
MFCDSLAFLVRCLMQATSSVNGRGYRPPATAALAQRILALYLG